MQTAAGVIEKTEAPGAGRVPVATRLNKTKLRGMVKRGETIDIQVTLTEKLGGAYFFSGKISVGKETAVRLEFAVTAADA